MKRKVTKVEKQAKRDRYNIYLDGVYGFSVGSRVLFDTGLQKDKELTEKEIEKIKESDESGKAYNRATLILSYRANTESELRKKLSKKFSQNTINRVISKLKEQDFINDNDFAERYVENSKKGKKLVKLELLKKGVDKELAEKAVEAKNKDQEMMNARKIAEKILKKYKNEPEIVQKKKLYQALTRKGFSYDIYKKINR